LTKKKHRYTDDTIYRSVRNTFFRWHILHDCWQNTYTLTQFEGLLAKTNSIHMAPSVWLMVKSSIFTKMTLSRHVCKQYMLANALLQSF
jgi:hypothetical protein